MKQAEREALKEFIFTNGIIGEARELNGKFVVNAVLGTTINNSRNYDIDIYKVIIRGGKVYCYTVDTSRPEYKKRFDYLLEDLTPFFNREEEQKWN